MKKEYIILVVIILLLSGYLMFHEEKTDHVVLPELPEINVDKIDSLKIKTAGETIVLVKKDNHWLIQGIERLADHIAVENMTDALKRFKLSALVSQQQDLKRYELDEKKQITVTLFEGSRPVFEFSMGKTAPTFNHTFVMIENDENIYHANGSFRNYFEKNIAQLRDKKVLEFKEKSIRKFSVEKDGRVKTFIAGQEEKEGEKPAVSWSDDAGETVSRETISALLGSLAFLECENFLEAGEKDDLDSQTPFCRISLENDSRVELRLYQPEDGQEKLSGISSMSQDAFLLSTFKGDEITSSVDQLLGIEKKETDKTN